MGLKTTDVKEFMNKRILLSKVGVWLLRLLINVSLAGENVPFLA